MKQIMIFLKWEIITVRYEQPSVNEDLLFTERKSEFERDNVTVTDTVYLSVNDFSTYSYQLPSSGPAFGVWPDRKRGASS